MNRTNDPNEIEHRLLELAYTTDAKITAPVLAYFAQCSIEDAEKVLDNLTARDRIQMEIAEDGSVYYQVPDRQKLPRPEPRPAPRQPMSLMTLPSAPLAVRGGREASPALAAILSIFIPGAGHLYTGRFVAALLWFLVVTAGYTLILPGLILHLFNIVSAAGSAHRLNEAVERLELANGSWRG